MIELVAVLLLFAFMVLVIAALIFAFARGVVWWQSRRPPPVAEERWEFSTRERDGDGGRAS